MSCISDDIELAPNWSMLKVEKSLNEKDVERLVEFLRSRHQNRFFDPIDCLKGADHRHTGYGFSMMALCCLLVETFQCYREGVPTTHSGEWGHLVGIQKKEAVGSNFQIPHVQPMNGKEAFQRFFADHSVAFNGLDGEQFYRNIRNGLLHQAQTKHGWKINIKYPVVWHPGSSSINRDLFAAALTNSFRAYLRDLEAAAWCSDLWRKAARKIWWLTRLSHP